MQQSASSRIEPQARPATPSAAAPPEHGLRTALISAACGLALAIFWSADLVDGIIGRGVANDVLGQNAAELTISTTLTGAVFAFVTGAAGALTACNVAAFGAVAPMVSGAGSRLGGLRAIAAPLGWLTIGAIAVAGTYGAVGVFIDGFIPQLSDQRLGDPQTGVRLRSIQSAVVFGLIGAVLVWRGLATLGLIRDPLLRTFERRPHLQPLLMGGLIGAFLVGRPYGLFRHLFEYAGSTDNPLVGFLTFGLQSLGNILPIAVLLVLFVVLGGTRFARWLGKNPGRTARFVAAPMIVAGAFFLAYWDLKLGARAGWWWWPELPYQR